MKFSLILATVNRINDVERFLAFLDLQTYKEFELIIVDQNEDNRLEALISYYSKRWSVKYLRSEKGLSRSRNLGLLHVEGDIVCFPDDDCWYSTTLLEQVANIFRNYPDCDGITGKSVDSYGNDTVTNWDSSEGKVTKLNVWKRCSSLSIFLQTKNLDESFRFDENLGVGAETLWGAGEDVDFLLKAIEKGLLIYYKPEVKVGHPVIQHDASNVRALSYGRGMGRVLRIHNYPIWFVTYLLLRSIGGMLFALLSRNILKFRFYRQSFIGRFEGWLLG